MLFRSENYSLIQYMKQPQRQYDRIDQNNRHCNTEAEPIRLRLSPQMSTKDYRWPEKHQKQITEKHLAIFYDPIPCIHFIPLSLPPSICNSSAFGFSVTESAHSKSPVARGRFLWQNLRILTHFAVNAKCWAELLRQFI